jgi:hypothetical protein
MPFVWRVVSNVPAPDGYFVKGAKAQLFAYQPRPGTPAGAWSGTVMGDSSYYYNQAHPMAQFTSIDSPLTQLTEAYPPVWDHLVELRLYLGAPNTPELTLHYAAADIQVTGKTWRLVAGGGSSCRAGKVTAVETAVHMPGAGNKPRPSPSATPTPTPTTSSPRPSGGQPRPATSSPRQAASGPPRTSGAGPGNASAALSHSSPAGVIAGLAIAVIAIVAVAIARRWWRRQRRATG